MSAETLPRGAPRGPGHTPRGDASGESPRIASIEQLRAWPKAEIHCHLDGSLRVRTALELGRAAGVKLPADDEAGLARFLTVPAACSLAECLSAFAHITPLLRAPESLERAAYELVEDSADDGIRYLEVRFAPALHAGPGFTVDDAVAAALRGLARGRRDFRAGSGLIVCLLRGYEAKGNAESFAALERAFSAAPGPEPAVVGLDLADFGGNQPTEAFADYFERANRRGIPITCHAGERPGGEDLRAALALGARRIGHGVGFARHPELLAEAVRRRVPVELCLSSNLRTGAIAALAEHPAKRLREAGLAVSFNTDDRGVFGISLSGEYAAALEAGFTLSELREAALAAPEQLFLPQPRRRRLAAQFREAMERLDVEQARTGQQT